jgi:hypothetical protein
VFNFGDQLPRGYSTLLAPLIGVPRNDALVPNGRYDVVEQLAHFLILGRIDGGNNGVPYEALATEPKRQIGRPDSFIALLIVVQYEAFAP